MADLRRVGLALVAFVAACNSGLGPPASPGEMGSVAPSASISAEVAAQAAMQFGGGPDAKVTATRLSSFGSEAPTSEVADAATIVWAVSLSGRFYPPSCGPAPIPPATPRGCPPPTTTALILIDAEMGSFIMAMTPDPHASQTP
jgi:hypothetical protein